jgi:hypothetical protein
MPRGAHENHQPGGRKFDPECTVAELANTIKQWCDNGTLERKDFLKKSKPDEVFRIGWCTAIAKLKGWCINTDSVKTFIERAIDGRSGLPINPSDGQMGLHSNDTVRVTGCANHYFDLILGRGHAV